MLRVCQSGIRDKYYKLKEIVLSSTYCSHIGFLLVSNCQENMQAGQACAIALELGLKIISAKRASKF